MRPPVAFSLSLLFGCGPSPSAPVAATASNAAPSATVPSAALASATSSPATSASAATKTKNMFGNGGFDDGWEPGPEFGTRDNCQSLCARVYPRCLPEMQKRSDTPLAWQSCDCRAKCR